MVRKECKCGQKCECECEVNVVKEEFTLLDQATLNSVCVSRMNWWIEMIFCILIMMQ